MAKKPNGMTEMEMSYQELVNTYLLNRSFSRFDLPMRASLKVKYIHRDLEPSVKIRDEKWTEILTTNGAEKDGDSWKTEMDGDSIAFKTKKGKTAAEKQITELGKEKVTVSFVPVRDGDLANANGLAMSPEFLLALEDAKLLVK